jgi:1-acyl-sn-glycerol-3-phosphate acyltransferase
VDVSCASLNGQYLIAANHRSWLDQLALMSGYPRPIHVLSKKGYFEYPVLGSAMRLSECLPVEDGTLQPGTLEQLMRYLERGDTALFFIEGTRGSGLEMLPFRQGVFKCSAAAKIPVLPVFIVGGERLMSKHRKLTDIHAGRMGVVIDPPVQFEYPTLRAAIAEFEKKFRTRYRALETGFAAGGRLEDLAAGK